MCDTTLKGPAKPGWPWKMSSPFPADVSYRKLGHLHSVRGNIQREPVFFFSSRKYNRLRREGNHTVLLDFGTLQKLCPPLRLRTLLSKPGDSSNSISLGASESNAQNNARSIRCRDFGIREEKIHGTTPFERSEHASQLAVVVC